MSFKEFLTGTHSIDSDEINLIRRMCYEIHMLEISDSIDYKSFNDIKYRTYLSSKIRDYLGNPV